MLAAAVLAAGPPPPYTVILAGVVDEEYRYRGVLHLLDRLAVGEVVGAVVGEPTDRCSARRPGASRGSTVAPGRTSCPTGARSTSTGARYPARIRWTCGAGRATS
jgi:hypothetical protein